jgi:hypothetical protein
VRRGSGNSRARAKMISLLHEVTGVVRPGRCHAMMVRNTEGRRFQCRWTLSFLGADTERGGCMCRGLAVPGRPHCWCVTPDVKIAPIP